MDNFTRTENVGTGLRLEYEELYRVLDYAMHELPAGVLWNPNAASAAQCHELMAVLYRFEALCKVLNIEKQEFIDGCRWHLEHYPHYLSRKRHFASYAEYISGQRGPLRVAS